MPACCVRFVFVLLVLATLSAETGPPRWAALASEAVEPPEPGALAVELPNDPPAEFVPSSDPTARSPAFAAAFGPYWTVQVNVDSLGRNVVGDAANEPSIAVNPLNPSNMVIGWRQFDSVTSDFRQAGWAYTFDGGLTWTFSGVLQPGVFRSDPVLDSDSFGNFYYQSLTLRGGYAVDVFRSIDGGQSWLPPAYSYGGDKNWLVVDKTGGIGNGNLYGIWQLAANTFTRSVDGGLTWMPPIRIPFSPSIGTLAVGPQGEVYAAGYDGTGRNAPPIFVVAKSDNARDRGVVPTFSSRLVNLGGDLAIGYLNPAGIMGQINVAADRSDRRSRGNVYVLASLSLSGPDPMDVHFVRSTDGGVTWTSPRRINDDPSGAWQWFGALSVAPNGRIDVIWNDTRNSGTCLPERIPGFCPEGTSQLFYAYSWDGGESWSPNVAVSPPFDSRVGWPVQRKIGDYYTLVSDHTGADVAYAATFNDEQDIYYVRLFPDCNENLISDVTDVAGGASTDRNSNLVPDECEEDIALPPRPWPRDADPSGSYTGPRRFARSF